jgi:hypothetical protein
MPSKYDEAILSTEDQQKIAGFQDAWKKAKAAGDSAGMQEAAAGADAIRRANGYTGGDDGSGFNAISPNEFYGNMANQAQGLYQDKQKVIEEWGQTQKDLQQQRTDFTIEQIEQDKAKAEKDYIKEQQGAYADWQKQSNAYGVNAEAMASQGMTGSGYSESSQVAMYTSYQNRVATARESYNNLKLEYDNMIKDAQLQNSAALAEIAYNTLITGLEIELEAFQVNNNLLTQQRNELLSLADSIWTKDFQERQFARQKEVEDRNYQLTVDEINRQLQSSVGSSSGSSKRSSKGSSDGSSDDNGVYLPPPPIDNTPQPAPTKKSLSTYKDYDLDTSNLKGLGLENESIESLYALAESGILELVPNEKTKMVSFKLKKIDDTGLKGTDYENADWDTIMSAIESGNITMTMTDNGILLKAYKGVRGRYSK